MYETACPGHWVPCCPQPSYWKQTLEVMWACSPTCGSQFLLPEHDHRCTHTFTYCTWFSLSFSSVQEAAFLCSLFTSETSLMRVSLLAFASISWTFTVSSRVAICPFRDAFSLHSSLIWRESNYSCPTKINNFMPLSLSNSDLYTPNDCITIWKQRKHYTLIHSKDYICKGSL